MRILLVEGTWLARRTRHLDLVHHGGGAVPPVRAKCPAVLTIHDLQYLRYPATFSAAKLAWLRRSVPASARRATVVVVPSEYVRSTVVEAFGTRPDRVVVSPHGLPSSQSSGQSSGQSSDQSSDQSSEGTDGPAPTPEAELRQRLGLTGRVVVYRQDALGPRDLSLVRPWPQVFAEPVAQRMVAQDVAGVERA